MMDYLKLLIKASNNSPTQWRSCNTRYDTMTQQQLPLSWTCSLLLIPSCAAFLVLVPMLCHVPHSHFLFLSLCCAMCPISFCSLHIPTPCPCFNCWQHPTPYCPLLRRLYSNSMLVTTLLKHSYPVLHSDQCSFLSSSIAMTVWTARSLSACVLGKLFYRPFSWLMIILIPISTPWQKYISPLLYALVYIFMFLAYAMPSCSLLC